jgi:hypothetical protein
MTLTQELREAIQGQPERPLVFQDEPTQATYVLMTEEQFRRLVYDDSDWTVEEMAAAAALTFLASEDGYVEPDDYSDENYRPSS